MSKNRNSCFRLRTARNTGIPATTVRKKAGRLLSCASISLSLSETNAEEIKSSCFLPDSCSRYAGISCSPKPKAGISVLAQSFGFGSVQPLMRIETRKKKEEEARSKEWLCLQENKLIDIDSVWHFL